MPRHFAITIDDESMATLRPFTLDSVIAVNGEQVPTTGRVLSDGDVILAGSGQFVFSVESPRVVTGTADDLDEAYLIETKAGVAHLLEGRSTMIGRDASNAIIVRNPTASRFHAELRREAGGFVLHSMGSAGTVRNGRLMNEPVLLGEGDQIEVAFTLFEFTRLPVEGRAEVAPRHSVENDDSTRKPTVATEWVVDEDGGRRQRANGIGCARAPGRRVFVPELHLAQAALAHRHIGLAFAA